MDYQEAIEIHIKECKHRIDIISEFIRKNGNYVKNECNKNIDVLKTAISAIQELQEYKKLGALEEVREAVEKQKAQEPQLMYGMYGRVYLCKKCGNEFELSSQYCPFCGQKQDWE